MDALKILRSALEGLSMASAFTEGGTKIAHSAMVDLRALMAELEDTKPTTRMIDAAMVEMQNITPPLRRSECERLIAAAIRATIATASESLPTVDCDVLPPIGSTVEIHLGSIDKWVPHKVVGYYAWGDLKGDRHLHRLFVRVVDKDGYLNARMLCDVRPHLRATNSTQLTSRSPTCS